MVVIRFTPNDPNTWIQNKRAQSHTCKESLNVFFFSLELQGSSEEIPKQILHHDAQAEGKEHKKTSCSFYFALILFVLGLT